MGKVKKEKPEVVEGAEVSIKEEESYEDKVHKCSIIAKPMAPKKLTKKCLKLIKKGKQSHSIQMGMSTYSFFLDSQLLSKRHISGTA